MSLSDRFSKLKSQPTGQNNQNGQGRVNRQITQVNNTKDKRQTQTQGKRGIQNNAPQNNGKKGNNNNNAKGGKRAPLIVGKGNKGKPNPRNSGGKDGKKTGPEGRVEDNGPPATLPGLDNDMDAYWFKAGKGPDPKAAGLDREMDAYFKTKAAAKEVVAEVAVVAAIVEAVPMTV